MIHGIGSDIVSVRRIADAIGRHGERFAERILSEAEWSEWQGRACDAAFLAKRFAAKEAFSKATGMGLRHPVSLANISVVHDALGKPGFVFGASLSEWLATQGVRQTHLSVTDEKEFACAFVILER